VFTGSFTSAGDELRRHIVDQPARRMSFVTGSGVFRRDDLDRDLAILTGYYLDHGFATVKIAPPALQLSHDGKRMLVTIAIEEGPRFTYGAIDVKGDLLGSPAGHLALIHSRPGATFRALVVEADAGARVHYRDLGFAGAAWPRPRRLAHHRIAVDPDRARQARVHQAHLHPRRQEQDTRRSTASRRSPGELFSATNLERSRQRVMALGYFEASRSRPPRDLDDMIDIESGPSRPTR
jgi:outer membrane protein insertion porin family